MEFLVVMAGLAVAFFALATALERLGLLDDACRCPECRAARRDARGRDVTRPY